jgi:hypothetical protein
MFTKGAILEFENQNEVFLTENIKEIIAIPAIRLIETSEDPNCNPGCAFDIHAYVTQGGNKDGMKIFTFEAQTVNLCKEWMTQLCNCTGTYVLKPKPNGEGYTSVVNDSLRKKKENYIARTGQKFVVIEKDRDNEEDVAGAFKKPYASHKSVNKEFAMEARKHEFFHANTAKRNVNSGRGHGVAPQSGGRGPGGRGFGTPVKGNAPEEAPEEATPRQESLADGVEEDEGEEEAAIPINDDFIPEPLPQKEVI